MAGVLTDEVVDQARTGSASAFAIIYREFSPAVLGYLRGKGVADPEAVTNDVFLVVLKQLSLFKGGAGDLRRFVFVVAHARMVDEARRTSRRPPTHEYVPERDSRTSDSAETIALRSLESRRLEQLMDQLGAGQKEVLLLRLVADLTLEQVGAVTGKSPGAVKQLQRRGLIALRKIIEQSEEDQPWRYTMAI